LSYFYLNLTGFESFIFGITIFVSWRIVAIWLRHEKSLDTLEKSVNIQFSIRQYSDEMRSVLLNLNYNYESVEKKYIQSNPFVVKLYGQRIRNINNALYSINNDNDDWFAFGTDIFRRFPSIIFGTRTIPEENANYFCAIEFLGESAKWFISAEGEAYLKHIDTYIQNKEMIKRIFIYNPADERLCEDCICIQLHKNSKYGVKAITVKAVKTFFEEGENPIQNDFAIYSNNFVWEKTSNLWEKTSKIVEIQRGRMSVNPDKIQIYKDIFDKLWKLQETPQVICNQCIEHCKDKHIEDLHELVDNWKREHINNKYCRNTQTGNIANVPLKS